MAKAKPRKPKCPFPVVLVEWDDACNAGSAWTDYPDVRADMAVNFTAGMLLEEKSTDTHLVVALTTTTALYDAEHLQLGERISIPRQMIRKVTRMVTKDARRMAQARAKQEEPSG